MAVAEADPSLITVRTSVRCPACGALSEGALTIPLASRSLEAIADACRWVESQPSPGGQACLSCGNEHLLVDGAAYDFDEEDAAPLVWVPGHGFTVDGDPVASEEEIAERAGRPFSLKDLHRLRVSPGAQAYLASPGVAVCVVQTPPEGPGQASELAERVVRAQDEALELAGESPDDVALVSWGQMGLRGGPGLWLGPRAADIQDESLSVISLVSLPLLRSELHRHAARAGLTAQFSGQQVLAGRDGASVAGSLEALAEQTVLIPATISEAAASFMFGIAGLLNATMAALELAAPGTRVLRWAGGTVAVMSGRAGGASAEIDVAAVTSRAGLDPGRAAEMIRAIALADGDGSLPCGCEPVPMAVVRPSEWVRHMHGRGEHVAWQEIAAGVAAVGAEDCPHYTRFPDGGERILDDAQARRAEAEFSGAMRKVAGASGDLAGAVCAGQNLASVAADVRLMRGLAHACGLRGDAAAVALVTCDIVCVCAQDSDPDLLRLAIGQAREDLAMPGHVEGDGALEIEGVFEFPLAGERCGTFSLDRF